MNLPQEGGFWDQWDIQVLNFQVVSILNIGALLFLATMSKTFVLTDIVNLAKWQLPDIYSFLAPIFAQMLSLVVVDSTTWLMNYDFGADNQMMLYWTVTIINAAILALGNGNTVLLLGLNALVGFAALGLTALTPILALSSPVSLLVISLVFIAIILPMMINLASELLSIAFSVLVVALIFDSIYLLITEPEAAIAEVTDLYERGLASSALAELEARLQSIFGVGFTHIFGSEVLQDIIENFWLHVGLQAGVVFPLTLVLTAAKLALFILGFVFISRGISDQIDRGESSFDMEMAVVGFIIEGWFVIFDGGLPAYIAFLILEQLFPGEYSFLYLPAAFFVFSFGHSVLTLQGLQWGINFLARLFHNWTSGHYVSESSEPLVQQSGSTIGNLFSALTPDNLEESDFRLVQDFTDPVIIGVLLPLVQVVAWGFQISFFVDMKEHIKGQEKATAVI